MAQNINDILAEREKTHGDFEKQAYTSRELKKVIQECYASIPRVHMEALDMISVKISRILHGDPNDISHWEDIAGYAVLAMRHAEKLKTVPAEDMLLASGNITKGMTSLYNVSEGSKVLKDIKKLNKAMKKTIFKKKSTKTRKPKRRK